jgi:hypothetical protein
MLDDLALGAVKAGVSENAAKGVERFVGRRHRRIIADLCGHTQRDSVGSGRICSEGRGPGPGPHPGPGPRRRNPNYSVTNPTKVSTPLSGSEPGVITTPKSP